MNWAAMWPLVYPSAGLPSAMEYPTPKKLRLRLPDSRSAIGRWLVTLAPATCLRRQEAGGFYQLALAATWAVSEPLRRTKDGDT